MAYSIVNSKGDKKDLGVARTRTASKEFKGSPRYKGGHFKRNRLADISRMLPSKVKVIKPK